MPSPKKKPCASCVECCNPEEGIKARRVELLQQRRAASRLEREGGKAFTEQKTQKKTESAASEESVRAQRGSSESQQEKSLGRISFLSASEDDEIKPDRLDSRTTLLMSNIPKRYDSERLLLEINKAREDLFDFVYLPRGRGGSLGHAIINFKDPREIPRFFRQHSGRRWGAGEQACRLAYCRVQGRSTVIALLQNKLCFFLG